MIADGNKVKFSFLTSGPTLTFLLPGDFQPVPFLSSPLSNGVGGRLFTFAGPDEKEGVTEETRLHATTESPQGYAIEVRERVGEPYVLWLRWQLRSGSLHTHLEEEDAHLLDATVVSLEILESPEASTPSLAPNPPLRAAPAARPGWHEFAFFSAREEGSPWSLSLERPGYLPEGVRMELPPEESVGGTVIRAGGSFGTEVKVAGDDGTRVHEVLNTVLATLAEG